MLERMMSDFFYMNMKLKFLIVLILTGLAIKV